MRRSESQRERDTDIAEGVILVPMHKDMRDEGHTCSCGQKVNAAKGIYCQDPYCQEYGLWEND